jgi:predicted 3-demethylubiquinone-9 3-methyltransferase (glyoxalase superfamily)
MGVIIAPLCNIVPRRLIALLRDPDAARAKRAMEAMLGMKRIDIAAIESAAEVR